MVHCAVDHFGALLRTIPCIQCTIPSTQHTIPKGAISPNSTYNLIRLIALMWGLPEVYGSTSVFDLINKSVHEGILRQILDPFCLQPEVEIVCFVELYASISYVLKKEGWISDLLVKATAFIMKHIRDIFSGNRKIMAGIIVRSR